MVSAKMPYVPQIPQPDLSVYCACSPEQFLPCFRGQLLSIPLSLWQALRKQVQEVHQPEQLPCGQWMTFIEKELQAGDELRCMEQYPAIHGCGPFYYLPEKISVCFPRYPNSHFFRAEEFFQRQQAVATLASPHPLLQRVVSQRSKSTKRVNLNGEELKKEIRICQTALAEQQQLAEKKELLSEALQTALQLLEKHADLQPKPIMTQEMPRLPAAAPEKKSCLQRICGWFSFRKEEKDSALPNLRRQHYFLALRLYEQACERYKNAWEQWPAYEAGFIEKIEAVCHHDRLCHSAIEKNLHLCSEVLQHSVIHRDYQTPHILETFLAYLETGRASHLQSCINLYEEEQHWNDLKSSQHRIENTILHWQPEPDSTPVLDAEALAFLHSLRSVLSQNA